MPALGMNQITGKIITWLKSKGDSVRVGDPVMEVETDKAIVEVEAQASGVLTEVRHPAGSEVPVGHVVGVIGDAAASLAFDNHAAPAEQAKAAETRPAATEQPPATIEQRTAAVVEQSPKEPLIAPSSD